MKIFYSWQSWTERKTNYAFIQDAIMEAIKHLKSDAALDVEPVLDRDTQGEAGSVAIAETIFRKIDECQVFICDVTPVTQLMIRDKHNEVPNPNVLIELGYASLKLGWERIICIVNTKHCQVEDLPFDLRHRRLLEYKFAVGDNEKSVKNELIADLRKALNSILERAKRTSIDTVVDIVSRVKQLIPDPSKQIELEDLIRESIETTYQNFTSKEFYTQRQAIIDRNDLNPLQRWSEHFSLYYRTCENALKIFATLSWYGNQQYTHSIQQGLQRWIESPTSDERFVQWRFIPVALLTYASGVPIVNRHYWNAMNVFVKATTPNPDYGNYVQTSIVEYIGQSLYLNFHRSLFESNLSVTIGQLSEQLLNPVFASLRLSGNDLTNTFDLFEVILSLIYMKLTPKRGSFEWMPPHVANINSRSWSYLIDFWRKAGQEHENFDLIRLRIFNNTQEVVDLLENYDKLWLAYNNRPFFKSDKPNYSIVYKNALET